MRTVGWLLICSALALPAGAALLRVTGDHVNLRAHPDAHTEVVGQVDHGGELRGTGETEGEWTAVVPPREINLWIFASLVKNGAVAVNRAQIRAGAGLNYKVVGSLDRGAPVESRGQLGDWLKIAPPKGTRLWVNSAYLEPVKPPQVPPPVTPPVTPPRPAPVVVVEPPAPKATPKPGPKPEPKPTDRPLPPPAYPRAGTDSPQPAAGGGALTVPSELAGESLSGQHAQGTSQEFSGSLSKTGWVWRSPSKYRLIQRDARGRALTVCYVVGNEEQLGPLLGRELTIRGRTFWLTGAAYPAVSAERITRRN